MGSKERIINIMEIGTLVPFKIYVSTTAYHSPQRY